MRGRIWLYASAALLAALMLGLVVNLPPSDAQASICCPGASISMYSSAAEYAGRYGLSTATTTRTPTPTQTCLPVNIVIGGNPPGKPVSIKGDQTRHNGLAADPKAVRSTVTAIAKPDAPVAFELDDGSAETSIGHSNATFDTEAAAVWLNRFTPPVGAYPIHLSSISVYWPAQATDNLTFTQQIARLLAYLDADGDGNPANATLVSGDWWYVVGVTNTFHTYPVDIDITGPGGDLYIGFEDYWAESGNFVPRFYPAALDTTPPNHVRSWIAAMSNNSAPNINDLGNNDILSTIDAQDRPGNLLIRAFGDAQGLPPVCAPTRTVTTGILPTITVTRTRTITRTPTQTGTRTPSPQPCGPDSNMVLTTNSGSLVPGIDLVPGSNGSTTGDDATFLITLPFAYRFYGQDLDTGRVSTNGQLQFNSSASTYYDICLPSSILNNAVLAYSADLDMRNQITTTLTLGIYTRTDGIAPDRTYTIEWRACRYAGNVCDQYANFEIVLYEQGEQFDIIYGRVDDGGAQATVGVQKLTGQRHTIYECNTPGSLFNGLRVHGAPPICPGTITPTLTATSPPTVTSTSTSTSTPTITPASVIVGHVMWYGHTEGSEQSLPITLTLKNGSIEVNYPQQTTNANGFFTVSTWLPPGMYDWRVKGPFGGANEDPHNTTGFLATSGMLALTSGLVQVEMGVQKTGDANGDNTVGLLDFNILRTSFGMFCGMAAYDNRADFTGNCIVSITDFSLLRYYFGAAGAPPIGPQGLLPGSGP